MSKPQSDWMERYNALVQFGLHHGHCNASYRHSVDLPDNAKPFKIGSWVVAQRKEKAMGRLDPEKVSLLQKLVEEGKFEWEPLTVSVRSDKTWPVMFQTLYEYCLNHPRKPVGSIPENLIWKNSEGIPIKLGRWMHTQNKLHRNGKLRQDRCDRIEVELIQTGLFTWPMTRGVRAFKRNMNNPNQVIQNVNMNDPNIDMAYRQHMTSNDGVVMQLHDAGGSMLLNNNNNLHLTADMYPMSNNKAAAMGYHTLGANAHLMNASMGMMNAAHNNMNMMNIVNSGMGMMKNEHMMVNSVNSNMASNLPYRMAAAAAAAASQMAQHQHQQHQQHQQAHQQAHQHQQHQHQQQQQQQQQQLLALQNANNHNDDDDDSSVDSE